MNAEVNRILQKVLKRITPTREQRKRVEQLARRLQEKVSQTAREMGVTAEVRVEGSVAKDTWLSEEPEIDIFMQIPPELPREMLGNVCLKVAKKAVEGAKQVERFAEHPYLEAFVDNVRINIVPCYRVKKGEWKSATDRTPYHTEYVKKRLNEKLRGEVRLLKRFMKGIGVYGAEIKVGGFSGYLCELLVISYGSFIGVLENFAEWKGKTVIDLERYYEKREDELRLMFPDPLVVVDPVDAGRNVAAAVRREKIAEFVAASRAFLEKPDEKFFYPPPIEPFNPKQIRVELRNRGSTLLFLTFGKVDAVSDVLWGQLYRTQKALRALLETHDFHVLRTSAWSDENELNVLVFELEQATLPPVKRHLGPPLAKRRECKKFVDKYLGSERTVCGPFVEDSRWVVEVRREVVDAAEFLREKLRDGGRTVGVAGKISDVLKEGFKVLLNEEVSDVYSWNREFARFLTGFLRGRPWWLERG